MDTPVKFKLSDYELKTTVDENPDKNEKPVTSSDNKPEASETLPAAPATTIPVENGKTPESSMESLLKAIDGPAALGFADILLSRGCSMVSNLFGYKTTFKDFSLTADEKKQLEPYFNTIVVEWLKHLTKEQLFYVMLAIIYGNKFLTVTNNQVRMKKTKGGANFETVNTGKRGRPPGAKNKTEEEKNAA